MKKTFLILQLIMLLGSAFCQERFFSLYPGWETTSCFETNDNYILFGTELVNDNNSNMPIVNVVDINGELNESCLYSSDTIFGFSFYTSNSYSSCNNYYIGSGIYLEFLKNYILNPVLCYFNKDSYQIDSIKDFKSYFSGSSAQFRFHCIVGDKIHIFGRRQIELNWDTKPIFCIYNQAQNAFSYKEYEKPADCRMTPYQALPTPDGGYLISTEQDMTYRIPHSVKAYILKVNAAGDEQWRLEVPAATHIPPWDLEAATYRPALFNAPDGNYWVVWSDPNVITTLYLDSNPQNTVWIGKLTDNSSSGVISEVRDLRPDLDNFERNYYIIQDSYQAENGDMYVLLQTDGGYRSAFAKIHSNGVGAWLRVYHCYPEDSEYNQTMLYGFTKTSDGGFILSGEFRSGASTLFPEGIQSALVFKVDSCGCFDAEGCNANCADTYAEYYVNMAEASIFPNPASDKITVGFEYEGGETEFEYKVYSLDGKLFSGGTTRQESRGNGCITTGTVGELESPAQGNCNLIFDICDLPSGYYTIQFWGGGKIFTGRFVKE